MDLDDPSLTRDIHTKDNILSKLSELGIKGKTSQLIVRDIFGKDVGTNRIPGLIDISDAVEFDTSIEGLKEKWISMHAQGEKFVDYFLKHKADAIRRTMTADIRSMAGLGWPSDSCIRFTTYAICEHSLAVAELDGSLSALFKCYKAMNH